MTTAYYRTLAADLEARNEWGRAAQAWQAAIDAYPKQPGQLAQRDIANMTGRRDACAEAA